MKRVKRIKKINVFAKRDFLKKKIKANVKNVKAIVKNALKLNKNALSVFNRKIEFFQIIRASVCKVLMKQDKIFVKNVFLKDLVFNVISATNLFLKATYVNVNQGTFYKKKIAFNVINFA